MCRLLGLAFRLDQFIVEDNGVVIQFNDRFPFRLTPDILVAPYTNLAWTPLFQLAVAVVVDSGGVGSHAAIVAREYGSRP